MATQAEMMHRICPFMSDSGHLTMCRGNLCNAFNSSPAYIFLSEDGESATYSWNKRKRLTDLSQVVKPVSGDLKDDIEEINRLVAEGWERQGVARSVYFRKPGEPNCWCDAMPGAFECQGGGG